MENANPVIDDRLKVMEDKVQEILTLIRQLVPAMTKDDFLKHCGNSGILVMDEWNKEVQNTQQNTQQNALIANEKW